jgi:hypothetical protein
MSIISCLETTSCLFKIAGQHPLALTTLQDSRRMRRRDRTDTQQKLGVVHSPRRQIRPVRHDLLGEPVLNDIQGQRIGRRGNSRKEDVRHVAQLLRYDVPDLLRGDSNAGIDNGFGAVGDLVGDGAALDRRQR